MVDTKNLQRKRLKEEKKTTIWKNLLGKTLLVLMVISWLGSVSALFVPIYSAGYKTPINIVNNEGTVLYNVTVKLELDKTNFDGWNITSVVDSSLIYFLDSDGSPIYYFVDVWDNTNQKGVIYVRIPEVPATGTTIYMYWGDINKYPEYSDESKVFDFYDGFETWSGWRQYGSGVVSQSADYAYRGTYSAKKDIYGDPSGACKALPITLTRSYVLEMRIMRTYLSGANLDRISVLDGSGNGYGFALDHDADSVRIDKRTGYSASSVVSVHLLGDPVNVWYLGILIWDNGDISAKVYDNNGNLLGSIITTDTSYSTFTQVCILGGYTYYVDELRLYIKHDVSYTISASEPVVVVIKTPKRYYSEITIVEQSGNDLYNYTIKLTLDSVNFDGWDKVYYENGSDIYFIDKNGNPLYYYIHDFSVADRTGTIYVKIPYIPANGNVTIYMVYGENTNPFSQYNDPEKVFLLYDSFDTLDTSKWIVVAGTPAVSNGELILSGSLTRIESVVTITGPVEVEYRAKTDGTTTGAKFAVILFANSGDYWGEGHTPKPGYSFVVQNVTTGWYFSIYWYSQVYGGNVVNNYKMSSPTTYGVYNIRTSNDGTVYADFPGEAGTVTSGDTLYNTGKLIIESYGTDGNRYFDYIFARKIVIPEPSKTIGPATPGEGFTAKVYYTNMNVEFPSAPASKNVNLTIVVTNVGILDDWIYVTVTNVTDSSNPQLLYNKNLTIPGQSSETITLTLTITTDQPMIQRLEVVGEHNGTCFDIPVRITLSIVSDYNYIGLVYGGDEFLDGRKLTTGLLDSISADSVQGDVLLLGSMLSGILIQVPIIYNLSATDTIQGGVALKGYYSEGVGVLFNSTTLIIARIYYDTTFKISNIYRTINITRYQGKVVKFYVQLEEFQGRIYISVNAYCDGNSTWLPDYDMTADIGMVDHISLINLTDTKLYLGDNILVMRGDYIRVQDLETPVFTINVTGEDYLGNKVEFSATNNDQNDAEEDIVTSTYASYALLVHRLHIVYPAILNIRIKVYGSGMPQQQFTIPAPGNIFYHVDVPEVFHPVNIIGNPELLTSAGILTSGYMFAIFIAMVKDKEDIVGAIMASSALMTMIGLLLGLELVWGIALTIFVASTSFLLFRTWRS